MMKQNQENKVIAVISRGIKTRHFMDSVEYDGLYDKVYADGTIERWCGNEFIGYIKNEVKR